MALPYLDTDILIRLLTGDDPTKQAAAAALFERVERGELTVVAPPTVLADAVFVLSSPRLYHLPRAHVAALLTPLVRLPHFRLHNRRALLAALQLYGSSTLDFGDCLIITSMQQERSQILYSYDSDFDGIAGIRREEP
ncbi:MAG: PIN domain-containing protein [Chloroflexi bacterium]|nr:PIN domain-containing protein [Chloroflexota bacterium]